MQPSSHPSKEKKVKTPWQHPLSIYFLIFSKKKKNGGSRVSQNRDKRRRLYLYPVWTFLAPPLFPLNFLIVIVFLYVTVFIGLSPIDNNKKKLKHEQQTITTKQQLLHRVWSWRRTTEKTTTEINQETNIQTRTRRTTENIHRASKQAGEEQKTEAK